MRTLYAFKYILAEVMHGKPPFDGYDDAPREKLIHRHLSPKKVTTITGQGQQDGAPQTNFGNKKGFASGAKRHSSPIGVTNITALGLGRRKTALVMSLTEVLPVSSIASLSSLLRQDGAAKKEQANTILFKRGDNASGVFVVLSGTVELSLGNDQSRRQVNRTMGPGTILGLPAAVSEEPYSMTATTLTSCDLIFVPREVIIRVLSSDPQLAMPLLQTLAHEVHQLREMWPQ